MSMYVDWVWQIASSTANQLLEMTGYTQWAEEMEAKGSGRQEVPIAAV